MRRLNPLAELRRAAKRVAVCLVLAFPLAALSLWLHWPGWSDGAVGLAIGTILACQDPGFRRDWKRLRGGPQA